MPIKDFSGNKGEWSEPYVVLRLLADGKLYQAGENMLPLENEFANVLEIVRGDTAAALDAEGVAIFVHKDEYGRVHHTTIGKEELRNKANRLFGSICHIAGSEGSFELPEFVPELRLLGFRRLTNPAPRAQRTTKRDLGLTVNSPRLGDARLGFSVKSELGAPPTLLNASEPTNIIYRVKGLTLAQANAINNMSGPRKIMDRCRAIMQSATSVKYDSYHSPVFKDNLEVVDSALPEMLADLLKVHYFQQILLPRGPRQIGTFRDADKLSSAVAMLSQTEPYASMRRRNFCEIKIKRFLRACALGLMPSEEWNGVDDASGGYIIVLPDGRLVALYVYNTNLFEKYLYESTIFERASTTRHKYLQLVRDGSTDDYLIKLNLQIRFNR